MSVMIERASGAQPSYKRTAATTMVVPKWVVWNHAGSANLASGGVSYAATKSVGGVPTWAGWGSLLAGLSAELPVGPRTVRGARRY
eukprot:727781-Pyramimonas_sp.AAC.1